MRKLGIETANALLMLEDNSESIWVYSRPIEEKGTLGVLMKKDDEYVYTEI